MSDAQSRIETELQTASTIAAAVAALLTPHAEVVLHDLSSGRIAGIWNRFSKRNVGDDSLLDEAPDAFEGEATVLGPYPKRETDGRLVRSVTAVLPSPDGRAPMGLLCINLDVSALEGAMEIIRSFLSADRERPEALFSRDWREQINFLMHEWLRAQNLTMGALERSEKIALVRFLDSKRLFETRKAAEHLADLIGVSRATVYNYISEARSDKTKGKAA